MFDLITGPYLVLIMDRQHVGKIRSHDVWKVARVALLPCTASGPSQVTPEQLRTEQAQLRTLVRMRILCRAGCGRFVIQRHESMQTMHKDFACIFRRRPCSTKTGCTFLTHTTCPYRERLCLMHCASVICRCYLSLTTGQPPYRGCTVMPDPISHRVPIAHTGSNSSTPRASPAILRDRVSGSGSVPYRAVYLMHCRSVTCIEAPRFTAHNENAHMHVL